MLPMRTQNCRETPQAYLPELGAYLITALTTLDVHNLTHGCDQLSAAESRKKQIQCRGAGVSGEELVEVSAFFAFPVRTAL